MNNNDIIQLYIDIERYLFPKMKMDAWQRSMYYHLISKTILTGAADALVTIDQLSLDLNMSDFKAREVIRELATMGVININDRSKKGHLVSVVLPRDKAGIVADDSPDDGVDIETIDFFSDKKYRNSIFRRDNSKCFYCMIDLVGRDFELDHMTPQADVLDNSYRNIVTSCHTCNKKKSDMDAKDYLRALYRNGILSELELTNRLELVDRVMAGEIIPEI